MVFSSLAFLLWFLPILFLLVLLTPSRRHNILLLTASLLFYAVGSGRFVLVLVATSALDWWLVHRMHAEREDRPTSAVLFRNLSMLLNLGMLGVFKYAGWISEVTDAIVGALHLGSSPVVQLALPIGISFFTFQRISYTIDVWRGEVEPLVRARDHLLFVALFPQLIAGPIVRYSEIRTQLHARHITSSDVAVGLARFVVGLSKKLLVADQVAGLADAAFGATGQLSSSQAWLGVLAYTVQIYFDFSAYSDMAIGLGRCFGFTFPENFARPYSAVSMTDFWRRWHMTLSRWFRDYVYVPLGGSRRSSGTTYRNLWIVFLLTGAWHGAAWTFVLWGAYHGAVLTLERASGNRAVEAVGSAVVVRRATTFLLVVLGWVLFRAASMSDALRVYAAMVGAGGEGAVAVDFAMTRATIGALAFGLGSVLLPRELVLGPVIERRTSGAAYGRIVLVGVALPVCILVAAAGTFSPFLYFRF